MKLYTIVVNIISFVAVMRETTEPGSIQIYYQGVMRDDQHVNA
jgi:hypothetical protein